MIPLRQHEIVLVEGLREHLGATVEIVRQNNMGVQPTYPYIAYTPTTLKAVRGGTGSEVTHGEAVPMTQVWSFSVLSDDSDACMELAFLAHDWFCSAGNTVLADKGIAVRRVGDITNRDNFTVVSYEYGQGFDVVLGMVSVMDTTRVKRSGWIETAPLQGKNKT